MRLVLAAVAVCLVAAACGGTTDTVDTSIVSDPEPVATTAPEPEPVTTTAPVDESPNTTEMMAGGIDAAETPLGSVLVNDGGRTLYIFTNDQGSDSVCYDGCETAWPVVGAGALASDGLDVTLGSAARTNGDEQLTINGRPVYLFSGDANAGDVNGQGSGGVWFVLGTDGEPITS